MKNTLRVTFVLLVLAATGTTAVIGQFDGPGGPPICGPAGCPGAQSISR